MQLQFDCSIAINRHVVLEFELLAGHGGKDHPYIVCGLHVPDTTNTQTSSLQEMTGEREQPLAHKEKANMRKSATKKKRGRDNHETERKKKRGKTNNTEEKIEGRKEGKKWLVEHHGREGVSESLHHAAHLPARTTAHHHQ